jgi:hypothetical protein
MRSSIFARWVRSKRLLAFVIVPSSASLLMILMYFSGNSYLQGLVSPAIYGVDHQVWTKLGVLELSQVLLLLCVLFFGLRCLLATKQVAVGILVLVIMLIVVFVLLQETGFGAHYVEYMNKPMAPARYTTSERPVADMQSQSEQVATMINASGAAVLLLLFLVLPVFSSSRGRFLRMVIPGPSFSLGALAALLMYWIAWKLESNGHGIIEGYRGALSYDLFEFLQFSVFYLLLLYMAILHERIHFKETKPFL